MLSIFMLSLLSCLCPVSTSASLSVVVLARFCAPIRRVFVVNGSSCVESFFSFQFVESDDADDREHDLDNVERHYRPWAVARRIKQPLRDDRRRAAENCRAQLVGQRDSGVTHAGRERFGKRGGEHRIVGGGTDRINDDRDSKKELVL